MDKNTLIGFLLILGIMVGFSYLNRPSEEELERQRVVQDSLQRVAMLSDTDAWVFYHKHTPIKDVDDSVYVCLEDGQWLVDVRLKPIPFLPPDTIRRKPDGNTPIKRLPIDRNASHTTSVPRGK